jgi:uncharacterized protein with HEPN domain
MRLEAKKYLFDIQRAAALIAEFTSGLCLEEYQTRPMVRAAVEREFEIVGEAIAQLIKVDTAVADRISDRRRIVAFRNILVHGYADVDDQLVWDVITTKLSTLQEEVNARPRVLPRAGVACKAAGRETTLVLMSALADARNAGKSLEETSRQG